MLSIFPYLLLVTVLSRVANVTGVSDYSNSTSTNETENKSSAYTAYMEIIVPFVKEPDEELEERISRIIADALAASRAKHLKQNPNIKPFKSLKYISDVSVKITERGRIGERTFLRFTTAINDEPLLGEVVVEDISLLSVSHISAILQYPIAKIASQKILDETATSRIWIVGLILLSGLVVLGLGWLSIFLYLNTCGAPILLSKAKQSKDEYSQYDTPSTKEDKSGDEMVKDVENSPSPPTIRPLQRNEIASEKKKNVLAVEIVDEPVVPKIISTQPTHSIVKKKRPTTPPTETKKTVETTGIRNDSWDEEPISTINIPTTKQNIYAEPQNRRTRPKAAGRTRPYRTSEGIVLNHMDQGEWSSYRAADALAAIYALRPTISREDHPRPSAPTEEGIVQVQQHMRRDLMSERL